MKRTKEKDAQPFHLRGGLATEWTPEESARYMGAFRWLVGINSVLKSDWFGEAGEVLGELKNLLHPIAALKFFGSVKEKIAEIDNVTRTIEIVKRNYPRWEKAHLDLEKVAADLKERATQLATAEKILDDAGWKFDREARKAKRIEKRDAERFFAACVRAVYKAKRMKRGNSDYVRTKIAATLAPWFDAEELSTESGGPIYMAIYKMKNAPG